MVNDLVLANLGKNGFFEVDVINRSFPIFNESIGEFSFKKTWFYISQYVKAHKIFKRDIVYIAIGLTFLGVLKDAPFILLAKLLKKQVVLHVHGNYLRTQYELLHSLKKRVFHYVLSKGDKGIVSSELLIDNLTPFFSRDNIYWMPYFVENALNDISEKEVVNTKTIRILYLSNLMKGKGVFDVLKALEILNDLGIGYEAKFVGGIDVENEEEVMSYLEKNPNIKYCKPIRGKEKKEIYLWANVFALPTYYILEGQPISLLEAMMAGNIIITTDHAGIKDICSENNGFIVEKKSPQHIADALKTIQQNLSSYQETMVGNHRYAKTNFRPDNFINQLSKILTD